MLAIVGIRRGLRRHHRRLPHGEGPHAVLLQPAEVLIIAGAASGTLLVANPIRTLKAIAGGARLGA